MNFTCKLQQYAFSAIKKNRFLLKKHELVSSISPLENNLTTITLFLFLVTVLPPINRLVLLHNTMPKPLEPKIPSNAVTMGYRSNCQISYLLRTAFFILLPSYLFICCGVDLNGFNQQLFKLLVF